MLKSQSLMLEQSEKRERINALLGIAELSDEQRAELEALTKRAQDLELELRAALTIEGDPVVETRTTIEDSEGRELRVLLEQANIGRIYEAALEKRSIDGPEAELQEHYKLGANMIPLELLRDRDLERRLVTPAPTDTGASQQRIVQPIFATGDAAFLNVSMESVPVGDAVFSVLSKRPTVGGPHTDSMEVAETTGAFTAESLSPGRLQSSYFYRMTDASRLSGMGEALREALSSSLSEALDKKVVDQIVTDVTRTTTSAAESFATYRTRLIYERLDGRFAPMEADLKILAGASTVSHMAIAYRGNSADESALDSVRRVSGGVRVSAHIEAVASQKQDAIVRRGAMKDAVVGLWPAVSLLDDPYTKASTGEVVLTAVLMAAFKVTRTDGFARISNQTSS